MNKDWIAFHLREALEQLQDSIDRLDRQQNYSETDFQIEISHVYHHINTAWNSRNASPDEVRDHSDADFDNWQQMPDADELLMGRLLE